MTKSCLDMPHSKMNSITAWLQQVETARSPIKPDISILRKPIESQIEAQEPTSQHQHQPFLTIVSPITPRPGRKPDDQAAGAERYCVAH